MARHPTARRVHREAPSSDDAFIEGVLRASAWAKERSKPLTIGAIVLVALVAGTILFRNHRAALRAAAATQLAQIRQTAQSGNDALAIRDIQTYLDQYGGTPSANEARLLLADVAIRAGQPQTAIDAVEPISRDLDEPLGTPAAFLLAASHEAAQQADRAEQIYLRIADGAPYVFQRERALDDAARIRMEQGNAAGAAEAYGWIIELLPLDDPNRAIYEMRRAEAQTRASTPR